MTFPSSTSALAYGPAGGQLHIRARNRPLTALLAELENACSAPLPNPWQSENPHLDLYLEQVPCERLETIFHHLHRQWRDSVVRH